MVSLPQEKNLSVTVCLTSNHEVYLWFLSMFPLCTASPLFLVFTLKQTTVLQPGPFQTCTPQKCTNPCLFPPPPAPLPWQIKFLLVLWYIPYNPYLYLLNLLSTCFLHYYLGYIWQLMSQSSKYKRETIGPQLPNYPRVFELG